MKNYTIATIIAVVALLSVAVTFAYIKTVEDNKVVSKQDFLFPSCEVMITRIPDTNLVDTQRVENKDGSIEVIYTVSVGPDEKIFMLDEEMLTILYKGFFLNESVGVTQ